MTTGKLPGEHGIVANGFYWREKQQVEMWTAPNDCIERPQIWDLLSHHEDRPDLGRVVSAAQQGLRGGLRLHARPDPQSRRQRIALVLHPADGTLRRTARQLWAIFRCSIIGGRWPTSKSSQWIADSAVFAARRWQPDFFYIYLPHLDYAAQRTGPDSAAADAAVAELDERDRPLGRRHGRGLSTKIRSGWRPANMSSTRSITSPIPTACCARPGC